MLQAVSLTLDAIEWNKEETSKAVKCSRAFDKGLSLWYKALQWETGVNGIIVRHKVRSTADDSAAEAIRHVSLEPCLEAALISEAADRRLEQGERPWKFLDQEHMRQSIDHAKEAFCFYTASRTRTCMKGLLSGWCKSPRLQRVRC